MNETIDIVDELLNLAKDPSLFTTDDMAELVMVAATEIIKLRQFPPVWTAPTRTRRRARACKLAHCPRARRSAKSRPR